jgi:hypothetical protein
MGPERCHVGWLVEEPEPLPFIAGLAEVFGVDEELIDALGLIGRIVRQGDGGAALAQGERRPQENEGQQWLSHDSGILPPRFDAAGSARPRDPSRGSDSGGLGRGQRDP